MREKKVHFFCFAIVYTDHHTLTPNSRKSLFGRLDWRYANYQLSQNHRLLDPTQNTNTNCPCCYHPSSTIRHYPHSQQSQSQSQSQPQSPNDSQLTSERASGAALPGDNHNNNHNNNKNNDNNNSVHHGFIQFFQLLQLFQLLPSLWNGSRICQRRSPALRKMPRRLLLQRRMFEMGL